MSMINAILLYLRSDEELVNLLDYTDDNRRINEFIPYDKEDYPYVVYNVSPFLADNITQYRCEFDILTKDARLCESIAKRLLDLMHYRKTGFVEDNQIIYSSRHVGGNGIIYDPDLEVFQQTLIFNIKSN